MPPRLYREKFRITKGERASQMGGKERRQDHRGDAETRRKTKTGRKERTKERERGDGGERRGDKSKKEHLESAEMAESAEKTPRARGEVEQVRCGGRGLRAKPSGLFAVRIRPPIVRAASSKQDETQAGWPFCVRFDARLSDIRMGRQSELSALHRVL